ncbi:MAG: putative 2OG-Fe(II) oxygenase [Allosphingosinicella sp.]
MTAWAPPEGEGLAPPPIARALLERAAAERPSDPRPQLGLAALALDRFDFETAEAALSRAVALDPAQAGAAAGLARCRNLLLRPAAALDALAAVPGPEYERAMALKRLGHDAEAEMELRAVLAGDPRHRHACRQLTKWLRKSGRGIETLALAEDLYAAGARHAQLFHDWGWALALAGDVAAAKSLLFDRTRVAEIVPPTPQGAADLETFNTALADEIASSPHLLSNFPEGEEANRGSSRLHALFAGQRPDLFRALIATLQSVVDDWRPASVGAFDPWLEARPVRARLKAWGLVQRGDDHEEWHIHRGGWVSGVYYVSIPGAVSSASDGRGAIEYGPPARLEAAMPGLIERWRHRPRAGSLLLAPSHYPHRTIPPRTSEPRISFAFDVVPC